jgi:hypothetical protein
MWLRREWRGSEGLASRVHWGCTPALERVVALTRNRKSVTGVAGRTQHSNCSAVAVKPAKFEADSVRERLRREFRRRLIRANEGTWPCSADRESVPPSLGATPGGVGRWLVAELQDPAGSLDPGHETGDIPAGSREGDSRRSDGVVQNYRFGREAVVLLCMKATVGRLGARLGRRRGTRGRNRRRPAHTSPGAAPRVDRRRPRCGCHPASPSSTSLIRAQLSGPSDITWRIIIE